MRDRATLEIPAGLEEEYYQINPDILQSFNKLRPPLNIYRFLENVARITPYYKVGDRLSKEQAQELADLVAEAVLPPPPTRRATKPTRGSHELRLKDKQRRTDVKRMRRPPTD